LYNFDSEYEYFKTCIMRLHLART